MNLAICELNHVAIHVADVARSCEFYRDVLRLEMLPRPAFDYPGAWFRLGENQELHLIGRRVEVPPQINSNNHFALRVNDIKAWENYLRRTNVQVAACQQRPDGAS